jgi:hypothetical protein
VRSEDDNRNVNCGDTERIDYVETLCVGKPEIYEQAIVRLNLEAFLG